jgi:Fe-S-cluster-containing hydrogenase component 2
MGCNICKIACATTYFRDESGRLARLKVETNNELDENVVTVCTQCNECIDICPVNALYKDKSGVVVLNREVCVNCLICVGYCPHGVMMYSKKSPVPFKCVSCGICVKNCSSGALSMKKK